MKKIALFSLMCCLGITNCFADMIYGVYFCREPNGATTVKEGNYSTSSVCEGWGLNDDGAESCQCQCTVDDNKKTKWKCNVKACKGQNNEGYYTLNKDKENNTGGKGVCEQQLKCVFEDGETLNLGEKREEDCDKAPDRSPFIENARTGKRCYRSCLEKNGTPHRFWSVKTCKDSTYNLIPFQSSEVAGYRPAVQGYKRCEKKSEPVKPGFCDKYKQWDKRYACCLAGKDTEWKGKDLSNDGTCVCKDGSKWEYNEKTKRGKCVANGTPVPPAAEEECVYEYDVTFVCKHGNETTTYHEQGSLPLKKTQMAGFDDCDEFNKRFSTDSDKWKELFGDLCNDNAESETPVVTPAPASSGPSDTEINNAQSTLKGFFDSAKKNASVWRTAEGNFNGARLASDITAGVVLGTVGGVVSGVVIKKNQVKKGFEALHCTVGGQKVAEWGDEFSVGLRR